MRFLKITGVATLLMIPIALYLETVQNEMSGSLLLGALNMFLMPGYLIYTLVTGDIHGWKPGPIGVNGRIIVTVLGAALAWSALIYLATRKRYR